MGVCGRHTVAVFAGSWPGGSDKRSLRSLPMVHCIRETIGKLAAATQGLLSLIQPGSGQTGQSREIQPAIAGQVGHRGVRYNAEGIRAGSGDTRPV